MDFPAQKLGIRNKGLFDYLIPGEVIRIHFPVFIG
jgi:hypothetical protein